MYTRSFLLTCAAASGALAQSAIFSNGSGNPAAAALGAQTASLSGIAAPPGGVYHELQGPAGNAEAGMLMGVACASDSSGSYRLADDFTVPAGGWHLSAVRFYAFVPGALGPAAPFVAANLRIWNGDPALAGSQVVFGDLATNRMSACTATHVYVVGNSMTPPAATPDSQRLLWECQLAVDVRLAPGTYWLDWQIEGVDPAQQSFAVPTYVAGQRGAAGANAEQFGYSGISRSYGWGAVSDPGKPASAVNARLDFPFVIFGAANCTADFNGDFVVDFFDYLDFVDAFANGSASADFNGDSAIDFFDYLDFLQVFSAGC